MTGSKAIRAAHRKLGVLVVCCLAAFVSVAPARADDPPNPGDISAADAYRESIPTASGPKATGGGGVRARLSPPAAARLGGVPEPEEQLLRDVSTSPAFGAPQRVLPAKSRRSRELDDRSLPSIAGTAEATADTFGEARLLGLALLLGIVTLGFGAVRFLQARPPAK